jgi:predicted AAA+ superfamily ATPase
MAIYRELHKKLDHYFQSDQPQGLILTGIVGCGKTTLIQSYLETVREKASIFSWTGDDIRFREAVAENSRYLVEYIESRSGSASRPIIFIDEVQKTEAVFDALKIAFDELQASFIVSGSNPEFLQTRAKKALHRRADLLFLNPLSLSEILTHEKLITSEMHSLFKEILLEKVSVDEIKCPVVNLTAPVERHLDSYLRYGGLPLVHLAQTDEHKQVEIRKVVERGFEALSFENDKTSELIRIELAKLHSREFAYQNIFGRTRLRRRERINEEIDRLINYGYLNRKTPVLLTEERKTYLSILSWIDPGIVTYLTGVNHPDDAELGFRIEGVVHARLDQLCKNESLKTELGYFKPHKIDVNGKIKYEQGEVDFIIHRGKRIIPIEVKKGTDLRQMDLTAMKNFLESPSSRVPFGIVLYGGVPQIQAKNRLIFWPWWAI